jgi:hypothetical protein
MKSRQNDPAYVLLGNTLDRQEVENLLVCLCFHYEFHVEVQLRIYCYYLRRRCNQYWLCDPLRRKFANCEDIL